MAPLPRMSRVVARAVRGGDGRRMGITYHAGRFVDDAEATVSIRNKAVNYGLGCFGGIRAYWDQSGEELYVFRLGEHVRRFVPHIPD